MSNSVGTSTKNQPDDPPRTLVEKLWELLRRNEAFQRDADSYFKTVTSPRSQLVPRPTPAILDPKGLREEFANVAFRWMLPPTYIRGRHCIKSGPAGAPTVVLKDGEQPPKNPHLLTVQQSWDKTPVGFRRDFQRSIFTWQGLERTMDLAVFDVEELEYRIGELHNLLAMVPKWPTRADEKDLQRYHQSVRDARAAISDYVLALQLELRKWSGCNLFAVRDVVYDENRLHDVLDEIKSSVAFVKRKKSDFLNRKSLLGTEQQWRDFLGFLFVGKYTLDNRNQGTVRNNVAVIRKLITEVYPTWKVDLPNLSLPEP